MTASTHAAAPAASTTPIRRRLTLLALALAALLPAACAQPRVESFTLPPPRTLVEVAPGQRVGPLQQRQVADLVATQIREHDVPATSRAIGVADYRVRASFVREGADVRVNFAVSDIQGQPVGSARSEPGAVDRLTRGDVALFNQMIRPAAPQIAALIRTREQQRANLPAAQALVLPRGGARIALLPSEAYSPDAQRIMAEQTRAALIRFGLVPTDSRDGADYILRPIAERKGLEGGRRRLEFTHDLNRRDGVDIGSIAQVKFVPTAQETSGFQSVADEISEVGAAGITELVGRTARHNASFHRGRAGLPPLAEQPAFAPPPVVAAPSGRSARRRR
ncbi:MAG: hypothetical protein IT557_10500 [Alphaproteobacteria bacterium]|nr:hypothetical protein [Alphaproteobacteria bacterium]